MALNKDIESIKEEDLLRLIVDEFPEGKYIDYKETLPGNTHDSKKEFLADISSFANAAGGHLVFGIKEEGGLPVELCGLQGIDSDAEIQRLDNMSRDNIQPRIPGLSLRAVPLRDRGVATVVHIPRSWGQPHVVNYSGHWKFYSRNSSGKYPLDVPELRAAFAISDTQAQRIKSFRTERLAKIVAGETPIGLEGTARLVLHIVPLGSFDPSLQYNVSSLSESKNNLAPICSMGFSRRHNFDGFLTFDAHVMTATASSYLQIFRNGSIEAVETLLLSREPSRALSIPSVAYEEKIIEALSRFVGIQKGLDVPPPFFVMLSFMGVHGYIMGVDRSRYLIHGSYAVDRNDLILPEIMIEDYEFNPAEVMRPAFDAIWNAAGWPRSMNYNEEGKWVGQ